MPTSKGPTLTHLVQEKDRKATTSFSKPAVRPRPQVCQESHEGRSREGAARVVQGALLIFTRPRGPGVAQGGRGATARTDVQGQALGRDRVQGSWQPLALMVTAT